MHSPDTFVSFDLETTGLDPDTCEIIEIGAVKCENGAITGEFSEPVRPRNRIPDYITSLTGIREEDVADALPVEEVFPAFCDFARGFVLVGQNVGFDLSFLRKAAGFGAVGLAVDTVRMARILLPQLSSYSLDNLMEFFSLESETRHRALSDARITAFVFLKLLDMLRHARTEFINEMLRLSTGVEEGLRTVFESQLRERLEARFSAPSGDIGTGVYPDIPLGDNIYGDFSEEQAAVEHVETVIDGDYVASLFEQDGALSRCHESYEYREGQRDLARKIAEAFNESNLLVAEAGTGTGKSIAYLIPALLWAEKARERVIISTNTKNLQEQLFTKDIPLVSALLDFPFRAVILKGRGNYICLNRWHHLVASPARLLSPEERGMLLPVASWLQTTRTGDLSETGFFTLLAESGLLERINSDSPLCLGPRCSHRDGCFVNRVRKAAQHSHVIIVNHSLIFSDMVSEGGVLGKYNRLVFDEAHNIEKTALRFLGVSLSSYRVTRILNHLYAENEKSHGQLAVLESWMEDVVKMSPRYEGARTLFISAREAVHQVRSDTRVLFEKLYRLVVPEAEESPSGSEGKLRYHAESSIFTNSADELDGFRRSIVFLTERLDEIMLFLSGISSSLLGMKEEHIIELEEMRKELEAALGDLDFLVGATGRNVFWFEFNVNGYYGSLKIKSAPLDIAEKLAYGLYDFMETVVMTSATMTVAGDFAYIRRRLGLDLDARDRVVDFTASSPFDYCTQAMVVTQSFLPSPKENAFIGDANDLIFTIAQGTRRGMLVLFTSYGHLNRAHYDLRDRFVHSGITLLAQGIDGSRTVLLQRFRKERRSVLFGTESFWEGVDVPGNALEIVVIVRLPFAVPTDPVVQAQLEDVEQSGGNPFLDYSVPEAAIRLRQGAGRLIRHRDDRGAIIILDKRVVTARYGKVFRTSLTGTEIWVSGPEMMIETIESWFERPDT